MALQPTRRNDQENVLSLAEQMFSDPFFKGFSSLEESFRTPSLDLSEADDSYVVELEAAGFDPEEFDVSFSNNTLTIHGKKADQREEEERDWHRTERRFGSFTRQVTLPRNVEAEEIDAEYKHGILRIWVPKAEESKTKQIDVQVQK